jgi:catalase
MINVKSSVAAALSAVAASVVAPAPTWAAPDDVATQIVDALNKLYGVHPGYRANHAKGLVVEGHFKPSPDAAAVTTSPIYAGVTLPVTVRFSDAGGLPNLSDGAPAANPHGMAIKFQLPDGAESDIVTNSLKFFPVATPEDFRDLQLAAAASPPGSPKPTPIEAFVASHPSVPKAIATLGTPASFADEQYNGVDAFVFTNQAGRKQAFRYIIAPEHVVHLSAADIAKKSPDYLVDELPERLKNGPVTFHIKAQLAAPGDPTKDPTQAWPDDRKVVDLGVLTIETAVADSAEAQKKLLFMPGNLTDGIEPSDDPLIDARDNAYAVSFGRRSQSQ